MISEKRTKDLIEMVNKTKVLGLLPYAFTLSWCNNDCDFCCLKPVRDNKLMSLEKFISIGDCEINWLKNNVDKLPKGTLLKHYFIGGEIGVLPEEYFNYFYEMFDSLCDIVSNKDVTLDITLFSNLILLKKQLNRLFCFFDYMSKKQQSINIATSFDLTGRFKNEMSLFLWKKNIETILNKKISLLIEVVVRKSSIYKYLNERDSDIVMLFEELLKMDSDRKLTVVFNEYQPYDSKSMDEVPTFEETCEFYNQMKNRHGTNLNVFVSHNINEKIEKNMFKSYCEAVEFIPMFNNEESPCELIPFTLWPKSDTIKKTDIIKNKLTGEFTCLKHPEKVENFFNNVYGCGLCKYKPWCSERHLRGCYQDHQFIWKNKKCVQKKLFEITNE